MKLATLLLCATILVPATTLLSQPPQKDVPSEIDQARVALRGAHDDLSKAGGDWGGHRSKAMEHIQEALKELNEAENWAKAHHDMK